MISVQLALSAFSLVPISAGKIFFGPVKKIGPVKGKVLVLPDMKNDFLNKLAGKTFHLKPLNRSGTVFFPRNFLRVIKVKKQKCGTSNVTEIRAKNEK